jgi:outer membrane receptor protein involved in Fe transport
MRFSLLILSLLLALPAEAASVAGIVVDASGAPVPGSVVTAGGASVTTGDDGLFTLADAPDGEVTVRVTAPGFAPGALVVSGNTTGARVVLQPAPLEDTVVVTASRGEERLATATATTVVTAAELLTSGSGALDDALRNTPGFSLFRRSSSRVSNPTTQGVTLRGVSGSGASRTLVLSDGMPLNDAFGSWVYWNRIPQASIERVEVVRGATGDLYGADALGGVVQVLTFAPGRPRLRASLDGGSHGTGRLSAYGGIPLNKWSVDGSAEWLRTDGVYVIGEEVRGTIDRKAESDYVTGFLGAAYNAGTWNAKVRLAGYSEERGNGTPAQVNKTDWTQISGDAGGTAGGGAWLVRASGGSQEFYQTFTAVAADRASERLTTEQTTPTTFGGGSGQYTRAYGSDVTLMVGGEGKRTDARVDEIRYSFTGVRSGPFFLGGTESIGSVFGRLGFVPREEASIVVGVRGDFWRSTPEEDPTLPSHSANFFSPRVSASWRFSEQLTAHGAVYRAHRTPTLNELHRGFRVGNVVTNANPSLDPETLTGVEGGVLFTRDRISARATGFFNQLANAITNVTISSTPALITRQRQNTDTVRATGVEIEADVRPYEGWTFGALLALTRSTFSSAPAQPNLEGNRVPQVPLVQFGLTATYVDPRGFTGAVQARAIGAQYDDDLNSPEFELGGFGVVDASASQTLLRGLNIFVAVENLFDADYDVGRTPIRTVGWPRTARIGIRVFLP